MQGASAGRSTVSQALPVIPRPFPPPAATRREQAHPIPSLPTACPGLFKHRLNVGFAASAEHREGTKYPKGRSRGGTQAPQPLPGAVAPSPTAPSSQGRGEPRELRSGEASAPSWAEGGCERDAQSTGAAAHIPADTGTASPNHAGGRGLPLELHRDGGNIWGPYSLLPAQEQSPETAEFWGV